MASSRPDLSGQLIDAFDSGMVNAKDLGCPNLNSEFHVNQLCIDEGQFEAWQDRLEFLTEGNDRSVLASQIV